MYACVPTKSFRKWRRCETWSYLCNRSACSFAFPNKIRSAILVPDNCGEFQTVAVNSRQLRCIPKGA